MAYDYTTQEEAAEQHSLIRNRYMANHLQPQRLMAAWTSSASPLTWPSGLPSPRHKIRGYRSSYPAPRPDILPAGLKNASTWSPLRTDRTGPSAPTRACPRSSHRKATVRAVSEATNHYTPSKRVPWLKSFALPTIESCLIPSDCTPWASSRLPWDSSPRHAYSLYLECYVPGPWNYHFGRNPCQCQCQECSLPSD